MRERGVDYIIVQNHNDYLGGYVKWFLDEPAMHCYPVTVIFPVDEEMVTIFHGSSDPAQAAPPEWALRGVRKRYSSPIMLSLNYATTYDADAVIAELSDKRGIRVSLINEDAMSAGFVKKVRAHCTGAEFVDMTDEIDLIKALKSPEEIECIRDNAILHDEAMKACFEAIAPGVREFEVAAAGRHKCLMLGSEQQIIFVASAPPGQPIPFNMPHAMNRTINHGDQVGILIEVNDAAGYYTHLYRIACLGDVPEELQKQHELVLTAQKHSLDLCRPGADPVEILKSNNEFLTSRGLPGETRIYAHGQGYDMVERPSFQPGETMKLETSMNIAVHPAAAGKHAFAMLTDNYIIEEDGVGPCLHQTPKQIFTL
jgi:Xaa-Pro aminopeptidase